MKVELTTSWFAATDIMKRTKVNEICGKFYDKGKYDMPESYRAILPKSAIILDDPPEPEEPRVDQRVNPGEIRALDARGAPKRKEPEGESLDTYDIARAGQDQIAALEAAAEEQDKKNREALEAKRAAHLAILEAQIQEVEDDAETETEAQTETAPEAPVKKRRGRPRKSA